MLAARRLALAEEERRHERFGYWRLALFIAGAWLAWKTLYRGDWNGWLILIPIAAFIATAVVHSFVLRRRERAQRGVAYFERGLARLDGNWAGTGSDGSRFLREHHLYAADLDLFGKGNLFQWLNQSRTRMGESTLAKWLLRTAPVAEIREREESVRELTPEVALREEMALLGETIAAGVHPNALRRWATGARDLPPPSWRWLVFGWNFLLLLVALVGYLTSHWGLTLLVLLGQGAFGYWLRPRVLHALHAASDAAHELEVFASALAVFEVREFQSAKLRELQGRLRADGRPPSERIRRLVRLAQWIDSRDSPAVRVAGPLLMLGTHLAFASDNWRAENGAMVGVWVEALGEIEALLSLSSFAFENPDFVWPEWESEGPPFLDGEEMRHPLLNPAKAVSNSLKVGDEAPLVLVSGSNMSGKSTFLRTIGMASVLAHAGAPVPAKRLRLTRLVVGASIATHDSLREGASRFFAEITRLRDIMALAESGEPVLVLLDELLSGTNSRDRRIGAEGVLRGLQQRGAIGLVTTHDLALADVAQARQVHFADSMRDGKIHFDYRMRPGVVPGSNALALMHALGLPVSEG